MKKNRLALPLFLLASLSLTSCMNANWGHYEAKEYYEELPFKDQFLICQLSDLHFSLITDLKREFNYLHRVLESFSVINELPSVRLPDLLILNGDTFMNANKYIVEETFNFFDELGIPYAFNFGNHDQQGSYTSNFIRSCLEKSEVALYKDQLHDDVYGNSNYVINLTYAEEIKYQIYMIDSNSYVTGDYDIVHDDQIEWYKRCLLDANGYETMPEVITNDTFKPSLAFCHIPPKIFQTAIDDFKLNHPSDVKIDKDNYVDVRHKVSCSTMDDNLIKTMKEMKSTVSLSCSHDHTNSMDLLYEPDSSWPMRFIYGDKTGDNAGFASDMIGATFYTLNEFIKMSENGNKLFFNISKIHVPYDEKEEVKVLWKN